MKHLYDRLIDAYADAFGMNNVSVLLYESFQEDPLCFLQDLINRFNLEINLTCVDFRPENKSLSKSWLGVFRFLNQFTFRYAETLKIKKNERLILPVPFLHYVLYYFYEYLSRSRFIKHAGSMEGLIEMDSLDLLRDYFRDSNRNLVTRYGLSEIIKYNYPV